MEGLHLFLRNKVRTGDIRGVHLNTSDVAISHLFYTDDVIILSDWDRKSMINIIKVFDEFYKSSGLKLNVSKSHIYGIGVTDTVVNQFASDMGCSKGSLPFKLESHRAKFFWGQSVGNKKIHWVKWEQVLASFDKGGLDIGSLRAFNCSFLCKWIWRFYNSDNSMWAIVLKGIHGQRAGLDGGTVLTNGIWANMLKVFNNAKRLGHLSSNTLRVKVGEG
ncbi:uncharacterized protein [Rutidosis leptorrhynchoides]|uniref:uncharacterized protein n=1 Tax=Rutidosis leptorrhynchoides TaxID=125765 RepID=UPI003A999944